MDLSILIPSRNEQLLAKTVDDIFAKAKGEFEVIVILDENDQELTPREGLTVLKKEGNPGLRSAINQGVAAAQGKYIMKCDAHVMFDEGFDIKLLEDMQDDWVMIPRRFSLDGHTWTVKTNRPMIDYEFMPFPYRVLTSVRFGGKWWERAEERKDILIDDEMAFQGSCWLTTKQHLENIGGFDINTSTGDEFVLESEELANKTWLSGGRVVINKKTWYAHLHKGSEWGRGYHFDREAAKRQRLFHIDYWMNNRWPKAIHTMEWLVDKFAPIPTWPEDWKDPKYERAFYQSTGSGWELNYILSRYGLEARPVIKLDCSRSYTLPKIFRLLGYKVGAEIGVERAVYSKILARRIPGLKLYGIDPWQFYEGYREHVPQERLDGFYEATIKRMEGYDYHPIRKYSMDAVKDFEDNSLDFVYIDGNHDYSHAQEDIREWHKKVRPGGIVAGHDYGNNRYMQAGGQKQIMRVKKAVDEWVVEQNIQPLFLLTKGDKYPTWFYVKA